MKCFLLLLLAHEPLLSLTYPMIVYGYPHPSCSWQHVGMCSLVWRRIALGWKSKLGCLEFSITHTSIFCIYCISVCTKLFQKFQCFQKFTSICGLISTDKSVYLEAIHMYIAGYGRPSPVPEHELWKILTEFGVPPWDFPLQTWNFPSQALLILSIIQYTIYCCPNPMATCCPPTYYYYGFPKNHDSVWNAVWSEYL